MACQYIDGMECKSQCCLPLQSLKTILILLNLFEKGKTDENLIKDILPEIYV